MEVTNFVWERTYPDKYPKSENRALVANKATVSASPKILQLHLWSEMSFAKYCLNGPTKWI